MDKIATIIINWNTTNDTLSCLKSLKENFNIIIVDNGSTDSEVELLKRELPKHVHLILNDKNYGFSVGNNQGIRYAIEHFQPDHILLLNSDTIVSPNFFEPLISLMQKDPKIGAAQPKILRIPSLFPLPPMDIGGARKIDSAGQIAYSYGGIRDIGIGKPDGPEYQQTKEVFGACAAAVLYRVSALREIGLFDEKLFSLFEDVDLSWRLRLKGYKIIYAPSSVVYHKRGVSGKIRRENKVIRRFYGFRNCLIVTIRYYPLLLIIIFLPIHLYRLITALYFKFRYRIKELLFKLMLDALKERKIIQKSPFVREIQKRWIL